MSEHVVKITSERGIPAQFLIEHLQDSLKQFSQSGKVEVEMAHPFDDKSEAVFDDVPAEGERLSAASTFLDYVRALAEARERRERQREQDEQDERQDYIDGVRERLLEALASRITDEPEGPEEPGKLECDCGLPHAIPEFPEDLDPFPLVTRVVFLLRGV